eukprot:TRINITY_DN90_c0_g1_i15.p2 TRINITY_DN90_c0_g1~~TRINITY_DN90_c0_g1_i15.p2  ORF type:complete len:108 (-),score=9.08 TRINITY_DN90_c0_g1_i15:39-362(-)
MGTPKPQNPDMRSCLSRQNKRNMQIIALKDRATSIKSHVKAIFTIPFPLHKAGGAAFRSHEAALHNAVAEVAGSALADGDEEAEGLRSSRHEAVSYTHLTLPTIYSV